MTRYVKETGGKHPIDFCQLPYDEKGNQVSPDELDTPKTERGKEDQRIVAQALVTGKTRFYHIDPHQTGGPLIELKKPKQRRLLIARNEVTGEVSVVRYSAKTHPTPEFAIPLPTLTAHPELMGDAKQKRKLETALRKKSTRDDWGPSDEEIQAQQDPLLTIPGQIFLELATTRPDELGRIANITIDEAAQGALLWAQNPKHQRLMITFPAHVVRKLALPEGFALTPPAEYLEALAVADTLNALALALFGQEVDKEE